MSQKAKYTKEELINSIVDMRLNKSASTKFILDFLMNDLGYSQSQSYEYLKWSRELVAATYNSKNESSIEEAIGEMESVAQYARANKNYKLWFEIRKELNKVKGVYAAQQIQVSGKLEHQITGIDLNIQYLPQQTPIEVKNLNDNNETKD